VSQQQHQSDPQILNRRSLERDHRRLADRLRPGMTVLDLGCGTGAITAGIAKAVGPSGQVLGVDRDSGLLALARKEHGNISSLCFEQGDALSLEFDGRFDIVSAARTLQWISEPQRAVERMKKAAKPGGQVLVLDYNHEGNSWEPDPPAEFQHFYRAFLDWRKANQWDNLLADHLHDVFQSAELRNIEVHVDDEIVKREDLDFFEAAGIWVHVIRGIGAQIVGAGFLHEAERLDAEIGYREWVKNSMRQQTLQMRTVCGEVK
jgi:ubiquinone/menaquinone biosynthesis C-methylase UbiE